MTDTRSTESWDEVQLPDIVKDWEAGDTQEGYYHGVETIGTGKDAFDVLIFQREDGTRWSTGASAGLRPLFRDIPVTSYVRVTMTGTKDTGKPEPMKQFKVLVRK